MSQNTENNNSENTQNTEQQKTAKKRFYACTISPKASTFYNQRL